MYDVLFADSVGTTIGTRRATESQVLDRLLVNGPRFGLHLNLSKCETYCPSGDQAFPGSRLKSHALGNFSMVHGAPWATGV